MVRTHPLARVETIALIAIGGFVGSNLRFLAGDLLPEVAAVLAVNVAGSFLLGFLLYEAQYTGIVDPTARVVFTTGVLSSFTTYSTFALQAALAASPIWLVAIVAGNYGLGFAGVVAARAVAAGLRDRRRSA